MNRKKIKQIKHQIKNGKLQLKTLTLETSHSQITEIAFVSFIESCLGQMNIKQSAIDFLDDALAGDEEKRSLATLLAIEFKKLDLSELKEAKAVTIVNKDAYESPAHFFKGEGNKND